MQIANQTAFIHYPLIQPSWRNHNNLFA